MNNVPSFKKEVENQLAIVASINKDLEEMKEMIKEMQSKKKAKEQAYDEIKSKIAAILDDIGVSKLNVGGFSISIRNNPASVEIENVTDIADEYIIEKTKFEVDKKSIKAFFKKTGVVPAGVRIASGRSITIKKEEDDARK